MISVAEAEARILAGARPTPAETIALTSQAAGRILAQDLRAGRTHPPHDVSAMDGHALRQADIAVLPADLAVAFAIPAGTMPPRAIEPGEAARIYTGAVIPDGADTIVIQENSAHAGDRVRILETSRAGQHIRRAGYDFAAGALLAEAGTPLSPALLGLCAAAHVTSLAVRRRPRVAFLATGDELVPPGIMPSGAGIVASTGVALAAMVQNWGGEALDLGIARDDLGDIRTKAANGLAADILVTQGGASVGDHDLVKPALEPLGLKVDFWKIAMRPGKPLMFGAIGATHVIGLPGNPVSALVCAHLFLQPLVRALSGESWRGQRLIPARLAAPVAANDQRQDYLRATVAITSEGPVATPLRLQDSGNLSGFARADALIVRAPHAPPAGAGDAISLLPLAPWL